MADTASISRDAFIAGTRRLARLALDGLPGVLLSLRGLRNSRIAAAAGDQDEAGRQIAEASGEVALNHPHCARFCVLGGASCSA